MTNKTKTVEELREAFKNANSPEEKKAIASEALDGKVCYWENCCKKWHEELYPFCSQEHKDLYDEKFPAPPLPLRHRNLSGEDFRQLVLGLRSGNVNKNVLREEPRQEKLI
jgi:hypothetical protein